MNGDDARRTFVAMLTAHCNDTAADDTPPIVAGLDRDELTYVLTLSLKMLAHEVRLGCADTNIPVDEYLSWIGLSAAGAHEGPAL